MIRVSLFPKSFQTYLIKNIIKKHGHTYTLQADAIKCHCCGMTSYNKGDMMHLFCLNCGYHKDIENFLQVPKKNKYAA